MKKNENFKKPGWVYLKKMGGNIPGGNFLRGNPPKWQFIER